ncbi:MAG: hypothetical protein AB4038_06435 [Prochloraceae cyanobacterium]
MVGLFRADAKFRDYWNSPLLNGFKKFDKLNLQRRRDSSEINRQLNELVVSFPNTYLAFRAQILNTLGMKYTWSKSGRGNLTGKNGEINCNWFYLERINDFNATILPDASGSSLAGVCTVQRPSNIQARLYNLLSLGQLKAELNRLLVIPKMRIARSFTEANGLLDKQVPLVAWVGSGKHWLVVVRPKGRPITFIDPYTSSSAKGVGTSTAPRLGPGVRAKGIYWSIARTPRFLYYIKGSVPLSYSGS